MVKLYKDKEFLGEMTIEEAQHRAKIMEMTLLNVGQEAGGMQIYKLFLDDDDAVGGLAENPKRPKKPAGTAACNEYCERFGLETPEERKARLRYLKPLNIEEDDVDVELISIESWVSH